MIDLGLSAADRRTFEATLRASHSMRVEVDVLDRNERTIGPLGLRIISGAVQIDASADVDRSLSLVCLDPEGRFSWAPSTPADAGLYADNFLAVRYVVAVPGLGDVAVPVFEGPITQVQRNQSTLQVDALGKESLYRDPHLAWTSTKIADRTNIDDVVRKILTAYGGEQRLNLNPQRLRTSDPVVIVRDAEPWAAAAKVAADANRQLFYDGRGRARLRTYGGDPCFRFSTGADGNVLTPPQITYSVDRVRNAVEVLGPEAKGPTPRPRVTAVAPNSHPLSAQSLARNGVWRWLVHRIELTKATSRGQMQSTANRSLADFLQAEVQVGFDALPAPHLEPMDMVSLTTDDGQQIGFRMTQFTIPLTATDPMSVGFLSRVRLTKRRSA